MSLLSLSLSHSSHSLLFPSILSLFLFTSARESRCNNGCPLIIGRPRHFKEIPRAHHETQFRSLLKISFSSSLCSLSHPLSLFLFLSRVRDVCNKNNQHNQLIREKLVLSRENIYRESTAAWFLVRSLERPYKAREMREMIVCTPK